MAGYLYAWEKKNYYYYYEQFPRIPKWTKAFAAEGYILNIKKALNHTTGNIGKHQPSASRTTDGGVAFLVDVPRQSSRSLRNLSHHTDSSPISGSRHCYLGRSRCHMLSELHWDRSSTCCWKAYTRRTSGRRLPGTLALGWGMATGGSYHCSHCRRIEYFLWGRTKCLRCYRRPEWRLGRGLTWRSRMSWPHCHGLLWQLFWFCIS